MTMTLMGFFTMLESMDFMTSLHRALMLMPGLYCQRFSHFFMRPLFLRTLFVLMSVFYTMRSLKRAILLVVVAVLFRGFAYFMRYLIIRVNV